LPYIPIILHPLSPRQHALYGAADGERPRGLTKEAKKGDDRHRARRAAVRQLRTAYKEAFSFVSDTKNIERGDIYSLRLMVVAFVVIL